MTARSIETPVVPAVPAVTASRLARGAARAGQHLAPGAFSLWRDALAVAFLAGCALWFFWPAITEGQIAYENDTRIFYYPLFARLDEALKSGLLPLWSNRIFGGFPIIADGESGALYPIHLLALLVAPLETAFVWLRPIRFFQAGLFTYLFCRTLGLGRFGALVGALSFAFCGFSFAQLHHTNISTASTWLPLALAFVELALQRSGRQRYAFVLLAGVAIGMQGLIIHVQIVLMSALLLATYTGFRVLTGPIGTGPGPASEFSTWIGRRLLPNQESTAATASESDGTPRTAPTRRNLGDSSVSANELSRPARDTELAAGNESAPVDVMPSAARDAATSVTISELVSVATGEAASVVISDAASVATSDAASVTTNEASSGANGEAVAAASAEAVSGLGHEAAASGETALNVDGRAPDNADVVFNPAETAADDAGVVTRAEGPEAENAGGVISAEGPRANHADVVIGIAETSPGNGEIAIGAVPAMAEASAAHWTTVPAPGWGATPENPVSRASNVNEMSPARPAGQASPVKSVSPVNLAIQAEQAPDTKWATPSRVLHQIVRTVLSRGALAAVIVGTAGLTGIALSAVQLLPLLELGTFSFRGDGVTYEFATQYSLAPVQWISFLLPDFFVVNGQYWGLWSRWEIFEYVGIAPLIMAVIGMLLSRRRLAVFFTLVAVVSLVLALGEHSPMGVHRMLSSLPGFSALRAPGRFIFLFSFACALLAAFGGDYLSRSLRAGGRDPRSLIASAKANRWVTRGFGLSMVLLVLQVLIMAAPLVVSLASAFAEGNKDLTVSWIQTNLMRQRGFDARWTAEHLYQFILAGLDVTQPSVLRQMALMVGVLASLVLWDRLRSAAVLWQGALIALLAADLVLYGRQFHPQMSFADLAAPSAAARYIEAQPGLFRVYTRKGTRDEPNRMLGFRIEEANGYSSLEPDRHQEYTARLEYAPSRLLDLMNARYYAVSNRYQGMPSFSLTSFDPRRPLLSSTGRNPAGTGTFRLDGSTADTLRVVSTLRWASGLAQGTQVAQITATEMSGKQQVFRLLAGMHTSDWSWERSDMRGKIPHQMAPVAHTWQQPDGPRQTFPAHFYFAEFSLGGRVRLRSVDVQFVHPTAQVELFGLSVLDDNTKDVEQLEMARMGKFQRVYSDRDVILYENQNYLPRAFLVPSAVVEPRGSEILNRMAQGDWSPERFVILEDQFDTSRLAAPAPPTAQVAPIQFNRQQGTESTSGPGTVRIVRHDADQLRLEVEAKQNAMLFLADLLYPGWEATLDGQAAQALRANYLFRAVYVPAGRHTVEFAYRPRSFRLGLLITLAATIGVVASLLWLAFGWPKREVSATMDLPGPRSLDSVEAVSEQRDRFDAAGAAGAPEGSQELLRGAGINGRQESEERREEEHPEEGGRNEEEVVLPAASS